jgi:transcriptional regulator with XRE-family HTH domain
MPTLKERFAQWLEQCYIEWQQQAGERHTLTEFAAWLEIGNPTLNQWMQGKALPRAEFAARLAKRLGLDVYKQLGMKPPDPLLFEIERNWERFTPQQKSKFQKIVARYTVTQ